MEIEKMINVLNKEYSIAYAYYTPQEQLMQLSKYVAKLIYDYSMFETRVICDDLNGLNIGEKMMLEQDIADIINIISQIIYNENLRTQNIEDIAIYRMLKHYKENLKNKFKK